VSITGQRVRIKLDENLGERCRRLLAEAGHEVATTQEEQLRGALDARLIAHCRAEERCLVTLDLDFANPLVFPPRENAGLVVLRPPARPSLEHLEECARTLIRGLQRETPVRKLWIVEVNRIREYQPEEDDT
jgi:predicted nuclease of predicted toxin-antitoxin system